ncbi:MAG: galactosyldiacylglycerol synthase [Bryobacteraceae bacterium]|jgi:1,2-diacylglycerol 3-beta-galactosyltransferase
MRRAIEFIYIDAGGGHRAAATALAEVIAGERRPWDIRTHSVQDLFHSIDVIRKSTGIDFQDVYNIMLRRGWTLGTAQLVPVMHAAIRLFHSAEVRVLERHWAASRPDMVVSLIPHYNRAFKQALDRAWPGTPLVTILTDIADYPPHFWIERQEQYVICGSRRAVDQARSLGLAASHIFEVSGMILNPRFHRPPALDRARELARLGLDPGRPTGIVMFGGEGSMEMVKIAKALNQSDLKTQLILLCGKHQTAARALRALAPRMPLRIESFTRDVPYFMSLGDYFVGKPGPGSISEALAMRLPVVVESNAWTLAHERYNAEWILERGAGLVVSSFSKVAGAVRELLQPDRLAQYRARAAAIRNLAVFEVPEILAEIFSRRDRDADNPMLWQAGVSAPQRAPHTRLQ